MTVDYIDDSKIASLLDYAELADAIGEAFRSEIETPIRHQHLIDVPGSPSGHLLLMPGWQPGAGLGIKLVTVFPGNADRGAATVNSGYLLFDAETGVPQAYLDGNELTLRRTAAASLLAARYLARPDSCRLLVVGTGKLAPHMARAYLHEFPLEVIRVWGRDAQRARAVADQLRDLDHRIECRIEVTQELARAVSDSDVISCATSTRQPLVRGEWLRPGQHLDLVGSFTADMREVDDTAMRRASLYVDTRAGTLAEAGELIQAIASGAIAEADILAELSELTCGQSRGRERDDAITLFKSVGCALEDLAAAQLVVRKSAASSQPSSR